MENTNSASYLFKFCFFAAGDSFADVFLGGCVARMKLQKNEDSDGVKVFQLVLKKYGNGF